MPCGSRGDELHPGSHGIDVFGHHGIMRSITQALRRVCVVWQAGRQAGAVPHEAHGMPHSVPGLIGAALASVLASCSQHTTGICDAGQLAGMESTGQENWERRRA